MHMHVDTYTPLIRPVTESAQYTKGKLKSKLRVTESYLTAWQTIIELGLSHLAFTLNAAAFSFFILREFEKHCLRNVT